MDSENKKDISEMLYKKAKLIFLSTSKAGLYETLHNGFVIESIHRKDLLPFFGFMEYNVKDLNRFMDDNKKYDALLAKMKVTDKYYGVIVAIKFFPAIIALGYVDQIGCQELVFSRLPQIQGIIDLMEEVKLKPQAIGLYLAWIEGFALLSLEKEKNNRRPDKHELIIEILNKGIKTYEKYQRTVNVKPWSVFEIIDIDDLNILMNLMGMNSNNGSNSVMYTYKRIKILLYKIYAEAHNKTKVFQLGLETLKILIEVEDDVLLMLGILDVAAVEFLDRLYLAQTNHILAVFMYKLVEYRRSLPETKRYLVDGAQAHASYIYTLYGLTLLKIGCALNSNGMSEIKTDCVRIFEAKDLDVYEKTFTTKPVFDKKKLLSIHKKTTSWAIRGETLNKTKPCEQLTTDLVFAKKRLNKLKVYINKVDL